MLSIVSLLALACTGCNTTGPNDLSVWGSSEAEVTVTGGKATLQILASGGCYGSYGEINQSLPSGSFTLAGTYSQLTGAYPGHFDYPAQFIGAIVGRTMTLRVSVPDLQQTLGPFVLTQGVAQTWQACRYP